MIPPWHRRPVAITAATILSGYLLWRLDHRSSHEEALRVLVGDLLLVDANATDADRTRIVSLVNTVNTMLEGFR